ncbi:hypothetical protein M433DRAFT_397929 [Acidomyces richmondensis BFW]|nr:MAG: hypothetical protein FE78DRAFT_292150 [Acidomyces sp. 'richmondensis']KYG48657.1 hypothetical protein M433DRAFT_397929 [Acidomyces richmondensis BFW]
MRHMSSRQPGRPVDDHDPQQQKSLQLTHTCRPCNAVRLSQPSTELEQGYVQMRCRTARLVRASIVPPFLSRLANTSLPVTPDFGLFLVPSSPIDAHRGFILILINWEGVGGVYIFLLPRHRGRLDRRTHPAPDSAGISRRPRMTSVAAYSA